MIEVSALLCLKPLGLDQALAVAKKERLTDWAPDYPQDSDVEIAAYLIDRRDAPWPCLSHYQIFDQKAQQVIGGIGYWKRGKNKEIEIGYSVVPSRRNARVATDCLRVFTAKLRTEFPDSALLLRIEQKNESSLAVAAKVGFSDISLDFDMCTLILHFQD